MDSSGLSVSFLIFSLTLRSEIVSSKYSFIYRYLVEELSAIYFFSINFLLSIHNAYIGALIMNDISLDVCLERGAEK